MSSLGGAQLLDVDSESDVEIAGSDATQPMWKHCVVGAVSVATAALALALISAAALSATAVPHRPPAPDRSLMSADDFFRHRGSVSGNFLSSGASSQYEGNHPHAQGGQLSHVTFGSSSSQGCYDTAGFVDESNYVCSDWSDYDCRDAADLFLYTQEGERELLRNCRSSCGLCHAQVSHSPASLEHEMENILNSANKGIVKNIAGPPTKDHCQYVQLLAPSGRNFDDKVQCCLLYQMACDHLAAKTSPKPQMRTAYGASSTKKPQPEPASSTYTTPSPTTTVLASTTTLPASTTHTTSSPFQQQPQNLHHSHSSMCPSGWRFTDGDIPGCGITGSCSHPNTATSAEDCASQCGASAHCKSFSWAVPGLVGSKATSCSSAPCRCFLYSSSKASAYIGTAVSEWGRVFCSKAPTPPPGHEAVAAAAMAKLSEKSYSWSEVICLLLLATVCGCCVIQKHKKRKAIREAESDSTDSDLNNKQEFFSASAKGGGKLPDAELDTLLADAGEEEQKTSQQLPLSTIQKLNAKNCKDASEEVDRILEARDPLVVLGGGNAAARKNNFRRLVRLLHPDKRYVTGERANLALRRVVEAQKALEDSP